MRKRAVCGVAGGPFGVYERGIGGYGPNSSWVRRACFFCRALQYGGDAFAEGRALAGRILDWTVGYNPFATSCVYGCGDLFLVPGWIRAYEIGSLLPRLALLSKPGKGIVRPFQLTANRQAYGNAESEAGAGVVFMEAMTLRNNLCSERPVKASR